MAAPATNIEFAKTGLRERIEAFFAGIGHKLTAYADSASRADKVRALNAKSDAELAKLGITRDDIPRYVFRDLFYI